MYEWYNYKPEPTDKSPDSESSSVTIGIGLVCGSGRFTVLASDTRVSYGKKGTAASISPNDDGGKIFDFHPLKLAGTVAGRLGVMHDIVGEMTLQFARLIKRQETGKPIYREHIENAIDKARNRQIRRRYNWAAQSNYGVTVDQLLTGKLPHGKLDPVAWAEIKKHVFSIPFLAEIIVVGFLEDEPVLFKASGIRDIEGYADPAVCVIGSTGARYAMEHLNKRGQNIHCSLAQTLLHVHEAMNIAKEKDDDGYIGPCKAYVVMMADIPGFGEVPHKAPTLLGWASAYKNRTDTSSLKMGIPQKQAEALIRRLSPGVRFETKIETALSKQKRPRSAL